MGCLLGVSGRTAIDFVAPKRFGVQSDRFGGSKVPNPHRSVPPPPLHKHQKSQKNDSQTGSWCLDKVMLGHRTVESSAIGPHRQTFALTHQVSRGGAAAHVVPSVQQGAVRRHDT